MVVSEAALHNNSTEKKNTTTISILMVWVYRWYCCYIDTGGPIFHVSQTKNDTRMWQDGILGKNGVIIASNLACWDAIPPSSLIHDVGEK
jgi:hypothetical protein